MKAYKCPQCSIIQLKGARCVEDGTILIECNLEIENSDQDLDRNNNSFVETDVQMKSLDEETQFSKDFVRNILEVANLNNQIPLSKPLENFQICKLKFTVPNQNVKANSIFQVCFLYDNFQQRANLFHEISHFNKQKELHDIEITVYVTTDLLDMNTKINYFYYLIEPSENNAIYEEFDFLYGQKLHWLDTRPNKYSSNHIDGLIVFKNDHLNIQYLKEKTIDICLRHPLSILFEDNFIERQHLFMALIHKISESLCSDNEYYFSFRNTLDKAFGGRIRKLSKIKDKNENDCVLALSLMYFMHKYDLNNFFEKTQLQTLLRSMEIKNLNFIQNVFGNFFNTYEQIDFVKDAFRRILSEIMNHQISESVVALFYLYFTLEPQFNNLNGFDETNDRYFTDTLRLNEAISNLINFSYGNISISEKTLNGLANHLKPLLVANKELSILFINYFCYNNHENLKVLIKPKCLPVKCWLNYLNFLNFYAIEPNQNKMNDQSKVLYSKILGELIQINIDYFNYNQTDQKYYQYNFDNFYTESFLLKYLTLKYVQEPDLIISLVNLSFIGYQILAKNPTMYDKLNCRSTLDEEYNYVARLINDWLKVECKNDIGQNYGFTVFSPIKSANPFELLAEGKIKVKYVNKEEPFIFDKLLSLFIPCDKNLNNKDLMSKKEFDNVVIDFLRSRVKQSKFDQIVRIASSFNFDNLKNKDSIRNVFEQVIVEKLSHNFDLIAEIDELLHGQVILEKLIDKVLNEKLEKFNDPCRISLESKLYHLVLKLYLQKQNDSTLLNQKWKDEFQKIFVSFQQMIDQLLNGDIEIFKIKLLNGNVENFLKFSELIFTLNPTSEYCKHKKYYQDIPKLVSIRVKECEKFNEYLTVLKSFLQFCAQSNNFSYGAYKNTLDNLVKINLNRTKLTTFCDPIRFHEIGNNPEPRVVFFSDIRKPEFDQMDQIYKLDRLKCVLLNHFYNLECKVKDTELKKVLTDVLPKALNHWYSLAQQIDIGSIKLIEIDQLLENNFGNKVDKILEELYYIIEYFSISNLRQRKIQLDVYFKFRDSYKTAVIIREVCQIYEITRHFTELDNILKLKSDEFKNWSLLKMDDRMKLLIQTLEKYSCGENIKCLEAFSKSSELTKWIKSNVKDLRELNFLVDLVSMTKSSDIQPSTGVEVFAKTLKEACSAYSPLIFGINTTISFNDFIKICNQVWVNLQNDPKIAEKLLAVKDQSSFLQEIKFKKGNVELSSIEKARQLNQKGVYQISLIDRNNPMSLNNLIELNIELERSKIQENNRMTKEVKNEKFSFEKLTELKSILMLVGKKSIDQANSVELEEAKTLEYFIEIFDNIVRLTEIYLKLINNGCDLFNNFRVKVYADSNDQRLSRGQVLIEISFNNVTIIQDNSEPTLKVLKDSCVKMENMFENWSSYVDKIRDGYYFINYFTIKQIILLRTSINLILQNGRVDLPGFELLSSLLYNIRNDLELASLHDLLVDLVNNSRRHSLISFANKQKTKKVNEINLKIFDFAKKNNFNVLLVKEAYNKFNNFDEEMFNFCIENGLEGFEDIEMFDDEDDEQMEVVDNGIPKFFGQKIEIFFDEFMKKQNDFNSNHISLERLAVLLQTLYESKLNKEIFRREVPGYLVHKGKPNLIMCSQQRDQIQIVLSIYASSKAPLPSNDEVLFCNSKTTAEEVCNFFRIAYQSKGDKIYTLINVQELTYENSSKIEKFLSSNTNLKQSDEYILVCICSTDRPEQSLITSSLIKYRVNPIPLQQQTIEEYLQLKLKSNSPNSLANHDFSKSQIRVLLSQRAGNGKSIYVENFKKSVPNFDRHFDYKIIRVKTTTLEIDSVMDKLFKSKSDRPSLFHIDIANEVFSNVDLFIFNLAVLNYLKHSNGKVWRRSSNDLYFIEIMPPFLRQATPQSFHSTLNYLPRITFRNPKQYLYELINNGRSNLPDNLYSRLFKSTKFQRSAMYLKMYRESPDNLMTYSFDPARDSLNETTCLKILLEYSGLKNPNWSDLYNFVNFLDNQIEVLENARLIRLVPYLKNVCSRFIIMMAQDFGIPSLNLADNNDVVSIGTDNRLEIQLDQLGIARRWENISHPYIIFNNDRETFTFMGIYLDRRRYKFINPNTGELIEDVQINLDANTRIALLQQRIPIYDNFNDFPRTKKINSLRHVMGLDYGELQNYDPDPTYELTLDNCLKLMAIFMRLRCNNPVIVMGETGCGKTRKLKFYSDLHIGPSKRSQVQHLIHFKVHGGTTYEDIINKVEQAERLSRLNYQRFFENKRNVTTAILFIDEANTTDAIGLIKEIMCDLTCDGRKIDLEHGLKIVAAVNPYRKHSQLMIEKLEQAGLGFYISANDSKEKIGHIPMRELVYRVQPLPASMLSLVWDFGQLNLETEDVYIVQMLKKASASGKLPTMDESELKDLSQMLVKSQNFMRSSDDECSFVSLRDIERVIKVTSWFMEKKDLFFPKMLEIKLDVCPNDSYQNKIPELKRAFILALAVCYHSSLYNMEKRYAYRKLVAENLSVNQSHPYSKHFDWILYEILKCQFVFLNEVDLANNIARNQALLENVFMIIICLELRIPLFIVGKPGSSKSLAKSIVESSMHGANSKKQLFQNLKQAYFLNFQCSPLTRSEMILDTFQEAAKFQENSNLDKFVSVVNLDEVGLAEASESMPLKTLHPLLEDGSDSSDVTALPHQKVAVIGISNWALDPAKMNRGIFVSRGEPDINELVESAKGICKYDLNIYNSIQPFIREIAQAYLEVCEEAKLCKREFFGLRDYYSLIKMVYWFCTRDGCLTWNKLEHSVKRNFDGLNIDMVEPFRRLLYSKLDNQERPTDPKCGPIDLIKAALKGENVESNSRYLLLITENYTVIDIIQNYLINSLSIPAHKVVVIFGSSFKHDLENTEICKNISKIRHSMEVGNTVILLNFQNLFESLYDVLNQYYQVFGGQRFVYLGINTQRVNCVVHENFRMIILSDRESVYDTKRFPIPLINRLEKHFLNASTMLNKGQLDLCAQLKAWLNKLTSLEIGSKLNDLFIGYHDDALANIILYLSKDGNFDYFKDNEDEEMSTDTSDKIINEAKQMILQCSTLDNIFRAYNRKLIDTKPQNSNLIELLKSTIKVNTSLTFNKSLFQVTTHAKFSLTRHNLKQIASTLGLNDSNISSCLLKSFDTSNQFAIKIKHFLTKPTDGKKLLIIQCDFGKKFESDLLSCTKFTIEEQLASLDKQLLKNSFIVLLVNFPREFSNKFIGFQVAQWSCHHVDEIDDTTDYLPSLENLQSKSLSKLLKESLYDENRGIKLESFLKILSNQSCSMIHDTNITRTIKRVSIFNNLCNNKKFMESIILRLVQLQEEKERDYSNKIVSENWFLKEVTNSKRINEYSTLKKSCQSYIETKLSPLLGFLLSKIDCFCNLDILLDSSNKWKSNLFLEILNNQEFLRISYSEMRNETLNQELNEFYCKSELFEKKFFSDEIQNLRSTLPFFWIIVQQLNDFVLNYLDSVNNSVKEDQKMENYISTVPDLFERTVCYKILKKTIDSNNSIDIFESYLRDFVLVNCNVRLDDEVKVITKAIKSSFQVYFDEQDVKLSFPLIHLTFESFKTKITTYLKFSLFNPSVNIKLMGKNSFDNIDLESCLSVINSFNREQEKMNNLENSSKKLSILLGMIRNLFVLAKDRSESDKYSEIVQNYESLKFLLQFLNDVCDKNFGRMIPTYPDLITTLKVTNLRKTLDFKRRETIELVHEFLIKCVKKARSHLFLQSSVSKCCKKECLIYKKLKTNDCSCFICSDCELACKSRLNGQRTICPACKNQINVQVVNNQISICLTDIPDNAKDFERFNQKLNLFYFNVIDSMVFRSTDSIPKPDLIESILRVITQGKILSNDMNSVPIDPKTRSLILQLILRNYFKASEFMNKWFTQTEADIKSSIFKSSLDMALSLVSCVEEIHSNNLINKNIDEQIQSTDEISMSLLNDSNILKTILTNQINRFDIVSLVYLSKLKFCMKTLAKVTQSQESIDSIKNRPLFDSFNTKMRQLIEPTLQITPTIFNFLVKEFIRKFSFSSVKYIMSNPTIQWMMPKEIIGDKINVSDRYILMGERYTQLKNALIDGFQNRNDTQLQAVLEKDPERLFPYFVISLYKNVTLLYKEVDNVPIEVFLPTISKHYYNQRRHWAPIVENNLTHKLVVNNENFNSIEFSLMLVQLKFSILFSRSNLIRSLANLIESPKDFKQSFIPCMPQDSLYDTFVALRQSARAGDNPTFYACPNGHPYVLFDCGRPWVVMKCRTCNEDIGGTGHNLLPRNTKLNIQDRSLRGYCLPNASSQNDEPAHERVLNAPAFHILRFIINASMYFACDTSEDDVSGIMTSHPVNLKQFFWDHMQKDLRIVARALNLNMDEVTILMHLITGSILRDIPSTTNINDKWTTKEDRSSYEKEFYENYLEPKLKVCGRLISEATRTLKEEDKQDDNESQRLYFMAYELLNEDKSRASYLYEKQEFWKYQPQCDFNVFKIELGFTEISEHLLLKQIVSVEHKLKLIKFLPDMIKLINYIHNQCFKQLHKHTVSNMDLKDALVKGIFSKSFTKENLQTSLKAFQHVWFNTKHYLPHYVREQLNEATVLNVDYEFKFDMDTKLSYFLPTKNGDGLLPYALIHYLASAQNEIVSFYARNNQVDKVELNLIEDKENLIDFDPDSDFLRIIRSNFIFESKENRFWFQYETINERVIDRYIKNKPLILTEITEFQFSDEIINHHSLFKKLNSVIEQEPIDPTLQCNIFNDFETIEQTADALNVLKILINYAKTTSGDKSEYIVDFIKKIYIDRNVESILKTNIIEQCQLKNLQYLWILLMMKKAFLNTINNTNPFENLNDRFMEPKEVDLRVALDPLKILSLSLVIYQLIIYCSNIVSDEVFDLTARQKINELFYTLENFNIFSSEDPSKLESFISPEETMKNIYSIWLKLAQFIKKSGDN